MLDFQGILDAAVEYEKEKNYSLAAYHYWLINFAFQDEEFPYSYTNAIGVDGRSGFRKMMKEHKHEILTSEEYQSFKQQELDLFPSYQKYFSNFERVVNWFIRKAPNGK